MPTRIRRYGLLFLSSISFYATRRQTFCINCKTNLQQNCETSKQLMKNIYFLQFFSKLEIDPQLSFSMSLVNYLK